MSEHRFDVALFDYDGVITDTAGIRAEGFVEVLAGESDDARNAIRAYARRHGGESRWVKFRHIYDKILQRPLPPALLDELCARYGEIVLERAHAAPFMPGARELLAEIHRTTECYVISGIPQTELRDLVERRGLQNMFRDVLGSPVHKSDLTAQVVAGYANRERVVFIGDSITDLDAARHAGIPFLGVGSPSNAAGLPPSVPVTADLMAYRPYFVS